MKIPFGDLKRQYSSHKEEFDKAIHEVLDSGWFVLGAKGDAFEKRFAEYCGVRYAVAVASGTEAIQLGLMAIGVSHGDEVITVANTCVPTVVGIVGAGATPVLVDVIAESFVMDPQDLRKKITPKTKAVVPVHLYGQSAELDAIAAVTEHYGIPIVEDAAQAHGTSFRGRKIGSIGALTCFSFYPSKNLGCFGDGGCVTTNDESLASKLKMLRNYGQRKRYYHEVKGINSRLDEMQAALLSIKLGYLDEWNQRRRSIAETYRTKIVNPRILLPVEVQYGVHCYHLFVVRVKKRLLFQRYLESNGIGTMIHYPIPIHLQEAFHDLGLKRGDFPVSEALSDEVVSIPNYPELTDDEVQYICDVSNAYED